MHLLLGYTTEIDLDDEQQRIVEHAVGEAFRNSQIPVLAIGGSQDHVHILTGFPIEGSFKEALTRIKRSSLNSVKREAIHLRWRRSYKAFSVSPHRLPRVIRYIERQSEHHQEIGYREEVRRLDERCEVAESMVRAFQRPETTG